MHLAFGWPAYILAGATGGYKYGKTSHFIPWGHTGVHMQGGKALFPSPRLKRRVLMSDVGIAAVVTGLVAWAVRVGPLRVMALYGFPYLVTNAWLVWAARLSLPSALSARTCLE